MELLKINNNNAYAYTKTCKGTESRPGIPGITKLRSFRTSWSVFFSFTSTHFEEPVPKNVNTGSSVK